MPILPVHHIGYIINYPAMYSYVCKEKIKRERWD